MATHSPDDPRQVLFDRLGITDTAPWEGMSAPEIMRELRTSLDLSLDDLARELSVRTGIAGLMEASHEPDKIIPVCNVLRPKLRKLAEEGWLGRENLASTPEVVRRKLLSEAGITDSAPWRGMEMPRLMKALHERAAHTEEKAGRQAKSQRLEHFWQDENNSAQPFWL